ncbi:Predicted dehydrogenase [Lachnospiraceae bacterium]|nr:Predicted dehydrogenase [Lachnospiraceae bacterium]
MGKNNSGNEMGKIKAGAIRIGIIGTGRIAASFVESADRMAGLVPTAVFNVRRSSAEKFAEEHGISKYTDDLCTFMNDVDAVYIASPHETHGDYARIALEYGKHVLCEKPMSLNREEAEKLCYLADQKDLILMEAIKTGFCDGFLRMMDEAEKGVVGEIHDIEASFTKVTGLDTRERTDKKYGGCFLELGSYNLLPIFRLYGTDYKEVKFQSVYAENGLDIYTKVFFDFGEGKYASAKCCFDVNTEGQIIISGDKGYILGEAPWWHTDHYKVHKGNSEVIDSNTFLYEGNGLQYEGVAFALRIRGEEKHNRKRDEREIIARAAVMEQFIRDNRSKRRRNSGKTLKPVEVD